MVAQCTDKNKFWACKEVPIQIPKQPVRVVVRVTKEICHDVTEQKCVDVPHQICKNVPGPIGCDYKYYKKTGDYYKRR